MNYRTVFDLGLTGYNTWWFPAVGVAFVAVISLALLPPLAKRVRRKELPWLGIFFFGLWALLSFWATYSDYRELARVLQSGQTRISVGLVHDFAPSPIDRRGPPEHFCVQADCFEYSSGKVTTGFQQLAAEGSPIRNGLPVRVTSYKGTILRLEVADSP